MANNPLFDNENPQKLVACYESRVGLTRFTSSTISDGPSALQSKCFNYLITEFVESMQIFDSLDSSFRIAEMVISDPINWRSAAPLTGMEIISVAYKNAISGGDSKMKVIHFTIQKITEAGLNSSLNSGHKRLTLKLVEFPAFHFLSSNQVYKTYPIDEKNTPSQRFSDIVSDTLKSIKDFSKWYNIDIEKSTANAVNLFIPNWIPLKVINYCRKYAISDVKKYPMYVFHIGQVDGVDKPTAFFKSIYSFVDNPNKSRVYGTSLQDVNKNDSNGSESSYSIADVMHTYSFEYFDAQRSSLLSGNTDVLFDYIEENTYVATNYDNYLKSTHKGLNAFPLYPKSAGNQFASFYRSGFNYKEGVINIKNECINEFANNLLHGGIACKSICSIYEHRKCGERAELIFNVADSEKKFDKMLSGSWITWSIIDHIINGMASSTITFLNDGFVEITDSTNTFSKINTISDSNTPDKIE
jgi:hypothetical protein